MDSINEQNDINSSITTFFVLIALLMLLLFWKGYSVFGFDKLQIFWSVWDYLFCFVQDLVAWGTIFIIWSFTQRKYKKVISLVIVLVCNLMLIIQMIDGRCKVLFLQHLTFNLINFGIEESSLLLPQFSIFGGVHYWPAFLISIALLNSPPLLIKVFIRIEVVKKNYQRVKWQRLIKNTGITCAILIIPLILIIMLLSDKPYGLNKNFFVSSIISSTKNIPGYYNHKARSTEQPVKLTDSNSFTHRKKPIAKAKKQNVILYILESTSYDYSLSVNATQTMPFLNSLTKKGALATPCYVQFAASTKSVFSILTGLYAAQTLEILESQIDNLSSLARVLKEFGYHTSFVTSQHLGYQGQKVQFKHMGFDKISTSHEIKSLPKNKELDLHENSIGVMDDKLMFSTIDKDILIKKQPFFITYYTTNPHYPYSFTENNHNGTDLQKYRNALLFADSVIKNLFDRLEQTGFLKNTLVIVTADHGEEFENDSFKGRGTTLSEITHKVPLLFYISGIDLKQNVPIARQVDIFPTILDLLSLKPLGVSLQGRSLLLSTKQEPIFLNTYGTSLSAALIEDGIKYIHLYDANQSWLIDLKTHPQGKKLQLMDQNNAQPFIKRMLEFKIYNEAYLRDLMNTNSSE